MQHKGAMMSKFKVGQRVVCYDESGRHTGIVFKECPTNYHVHIRHDNKEFNDKCYHIKQCRRLFKMLRFGDRAYFLNGFGEKCKGTILDRLKLGAYILRRDGTEYSWSFFKRSELTRLVKKKKESSELRVGDVVSYQGKEYRLTFIYNDHATIQRLVPNPFHEGGLGWIEKEIINVGNIKQLELIRKGN